MVILVYDVHASESGALAILNDLYKQICNYTDKSIKWIFTVSTPQYQETDNIKVLRFPWVKKSWLHRLFFYNITTRKILKQYKPDRVFSLQNKGISFYKGVQCVYLHLPFILCDYIFDIRRDGKKLWFYQNVISKVIFKSLRKVDRTIIQTQWMKDALVRRANVNSEKIVLLPPDISMNNISSYNYTHENRKRFFYPATAFTYKNHMTILKACNYIQSQRINDYEVIFTICHDENRYTQWLYEYAKEHKLNVRFGGSIPREQVFEMYTKSVLLFPSFVESFGLPLLEARLSGTFIVASDCQFSREILDGYANVNYFQELDYEKMGDYMINIIEGKNKYSLQLKNDNITINKSSIGLVDIVLNI